MTRSTTGSTRSQYLDPHRTRRSSLSEYPSHWKTPKTPEPLTTGIRSARLTRLESLQLASLDAILDRDGLVGGEARCREGSQRGLHERGGQCSRSLRYCVSFCRGVFARGERVEQVHGKGYKFLS
jgi:hypothetical protein